MEKTDKQVKVCVFDICGTLYQSNTTFDFLDFLFRENKKYIWYKRIYKSSPWRLLNKILRVYFDVDLTRMLALKFLKGFCKEELQSLAEEFYNQFLDQRRNNNVLQVLEEKLNNKNFRVILLSATIDVVANVIAQKLNCNEFYSTTLKYNNGKCTGEISNDMLGKKQQFIKELNLVPSIELFVTDDISDINVLDLSRNRIIVVYYKNKNQWKRILKQKKWNVELLEV